MSYEFKKLSEVEVTDVADSSVNLIVETNDDIKKLNIGDLPIGQEQADWNEEDATKASFIKNKPDLSQVGGSGGKITIIDTHTYYASGIDVKTMTFADTGEAVTMAKLYEALLSGSVWFKTHFWGSGASSPNDQYYLIEYFAHYEEYTYTNMSGFVSTNPEELVVGLRIADKRVTYTFR